MKIDHLAIWTNDLEQLRRFYEGYFGAQAGEKYVNERKHFESYFLEFSSGARLELMTKTGVENSVRHDNIHVGYAHMAFAIGSKAAVDALTERLRADGYVIASEPRTTGDGFYESCVLDPEGNLVELTE